MNGKLNVQTNHASNEATETVGEADANGANEKFEEPLESGVVVTDPADLPDGKKRRRKRPTKSAAKRGLGKPTGMEEFFADAPLTPAEYEEQKSLYDPAINFLDRLLTAIQRFERTRKLTPERRDIFYKWLHYGGIRISSHVGTGAQNFNELDKDQTAVALSHALITDELREALESKETEQAKYAVDFMGCMRGFLSRHAPSIYGFEKKGDVELITTTLERFLDYLMQHEVCPEYQDDICATRNFCREASHQMWSCAEAQRWLPGDFNIACSTLLDGNYARDYDGKTLWGDEARGGFVGLTEEEASQIFGFAMAGAASPEVYDDYFRLTQGKDCDEGLQVIQVLENQGFEIVNLESPTADCKELYKNNTDKYRPVGKMTTRPWKNPEVPPEDLTDEEKQTSSTDPETSRQYVFLLEEVVMQHLSIGQKITATIRQVNCGIWFFDEFTRILPNFDIWLVNELIEDFKEPRWLKDAYVPGAPGWTDKEDTVEDGHVNKKDALNEASS